MKRNFHQKAIQFVSTLFPDDKEIKTKIGNCLKNMILLI